MPIEKSSHTGRQFETDCLFATGRVPKLSTEEPVYKDLRLAVEECIKNPTGYTTHELSDPPSRWMNDLHCLTGEALGLDDLDGLKIYPALGTAADRYHGIDFLMVYTDPLTKSEAIVSADLTEQSTKVQKGYKADVIISSTAASANENFYSMGETGRYSLPDRSKTTVDEERADDLKRKKWLAKIIANIIQEKLESGDEHYSVLYKGSQLLALHEISRESRTDIGRTFASHRPLQQA